MRNTISTQVFRETPDPFAHERDKPEVIRNCADCIHCIEALSLWCVQPEAIEARGTKIPGIVHCPYWEGNARALKKIARNRTKEIETWEYWGIKIV